MNESCNCHHGRTCVPCYRKETFLSNLAHTLILASGFTLISLLLIVFELLK